MTIILVSNDLPVLWIIREIFHCWQHSSENKKIMLCFCWHESVLQHKWGFMEMSCLISSVLLLHWYDLHRHWWFGVCSNTGKMSHPIKSTTTLSSVDCTPWVWDAFCFLFHCWAFCVIIFILFLSMDFHILFASLTRSRLWRKLKFIDWPLGASSSLTSILKLSNFAEEINRFSAWFK